MPEEKTVDIDTTGPGAEVDIEEKKEIGLFLHVTQDQDYPSKAEKCAS